MRRSIVWPLTVLLATVTGALLSSTADLLTTPVVPGPNGTVGVATVERFYQGVNDLLRTGDSSTLDDVVSSDFVDYAVAPGLSPTQEGLKLLLLDLRVIAPSLQFIPEDIVPFGNFAVARIHVEGATDDQLFGLPLGNTIIPLGPVDLFGVEGGHIVTHWGSPAGARAEPFGAISLDDLAGTPQLLSQSRWTFPAHTWVQVTTGEGTHLFVTESGELTATIEGSTTKPVSVSVGMLGDQIPVSPGISIPVARGNVLTVPAKTVVRLMNNTPDDLSVIAAEIVPPGAGEFTTLRFDPAYNPPPSTIDTARVATFPGGITLRPLTISHTLYLPTTPIAVVARITLAVGESLPPYTLAGGTSVAVESGKIDLETGIDLAWVRRGTSGASGEMSRPSLDAGDGAYLSPGMTLGIRNQADTPTTVVIFSIVSS